LYHLRLWWSTHYRIYVSHIYNALSALLLLLVLHWRGLHHHLLLWSLLKRWSWWASLHRLLLRRPHWQRLSRGWLLWSILSLRWMELLLLPGKLRLLHLLRLHPNVDCKLL
jgi:hypothetical protein